MSIRFTVTDRATGEVMNIEAPRTGEHVKNGVKRVIPPSPEAVSNIMEVLKVRSKLGARGGCLA